MLPDFLPPAAGSAHLTQGGREKMTSTEVSDTNPQSFASVRGAVFSPLRGVSSSRDK